MKKIEIGHCQEIDEKLEFRSGSFAPKKISFPLKFVDDRALYALLKVERKTNLSLIKVRCKLLTAPF